MDTIEHTKNLGLPLLVPNQSGKEFTHNEALVMLDNLIGSGVKTIADTPPTDFDDGDRYLVGTNPSGDFLNRENQIAFYDNGWRFIKVRAGQMIWISDMKKLYVFNGNNWQEEDRTDPRFTTVNPQIGDILSYNGLNFSNENNLERLKNISLDGNFTVKNADGYENYRLKIEEDQSIVSVQSENQGWLDSFSIDNKTGIVDFKRDITLQGQALANEGSGGGDSNLELLNSYSIDTAISLMEFTDLDADCSHKFIFHGLKGGNSSGVILYCQIGAGSYFTNYYNWLLELDVSTSTTETRRCGKLASSFQLTDNTYSFAGVKTSLSCDVEVTLKTNPSGCQDKYMTSRVITAAMDDLTDMLSISTRGSCFVYNTNRFSKIKFFLASGNFTAGQVKHYKIR